MVPLGSNGLKWIRKISAYFPVNQKGEKLLQHSFFY